MDHHILFDSEVEVPPDLSAQLELVITAALTAEGVAVPCEISVLITDDRGIHEINLDQRGVDRPTDVLSFPMFQLQAGTPPAQEGYLDPATGRMPLGDMVLSLDRAREQAQEFGHSLQREVSYLTVHSVLHLLGYDHLDEGEEKARMRAREEEILTQLGIPRG